MLYPCGAVHTYYMYVACSTCVHVCMYVCMWLKVITHVCKMANIKGTVPGIHVQFNNLCILYF